MKSKILEFIQRNPETWEQRLNEDYTYIFELVSPQNQIVIRYEKTLLFYLAARNNKTGEEVDNELPGFIKPKSYSLRTLEECVEAAETLNDGSLLLMKDLKVQQLIMCIRFCILHSAWQYVMDYSE